MVTLKLLVTGVAPRKAIQVEPTAPKSQLVVRKIEQQSHKLNYLDLR